MQTEHDIKKNHENHGHHDIVMLNVDGKEIPFQKGNYSVAELKAKLNIPADYELDLVKDGQFIPLADNTILEIEKPAIFVSHVRSGASS